eukprot:TRINITY_DN18741_c0_g1_i1.p1 TRINITY_DN18741_c0_g1~~TRINITY_DN18741_c0_g1_i1.p1  ORF type:complete len:337 (+),score=75.66 TRINITY_DN18741_c0_g1_i1:230-1240(+)
MRRVLSISHSVIGNTRSGSNFSGSLSPSFDGLASSSSAQPSASIPVPAGPRVRPPLSSDSEYVAQSSSDALFEHGRPEDSDEQWSDGHRPDGFGATGPLAAAATALALPTLLDSDDVRNVRDEMVAIMENKDFSADQVTVFSSVCRIAEDKNVQTAIFQNPEFKNLFYGSQGSQFAQQFALEARQPRAEPDAGGSAAEPAPPTPTLSVPAELTPDEFVQHRVMLCHKCARSVTIEECETDSDDRCHSDADTPLSEGSPGTPPAPPTPLSSMAGAAHLIIPLVCATLMGVVFVKYGDVISVTINTIVHRIDLREWGRFLILGAMESFFGRKFISRKL